MDTETLTKVLHESADEFNRRFPDSKATVTGETMSRPPLNDEFGTILTTESDEPGAPFFDKTLNFLQHHFDKTNSEVGKLTQKKYKIEDDIAIKEGERETTRALLVEEYRNRRPFNPETGEAIAPPFGEADERGYGDDVDE